MSRVGMGLDLTAGQQRGGGGGGGPWTPGDEDTLRFAMLPALSVAASKLWQDTGRALLATAQNDPVFRAKDVYTGLEAVAPQTSQRPWLQFRSGKALLAYDGTSFSNTVSLSLTQPFSVWCTVNHVANSYGRVMDADYGGDFKRAIFGGNGTSWQLYAGGTVLTAAGFDAGVDHVVGAVFNGGASKLYVDGAAVISGDPGSSGTNGTVYWCSDKTGAAAAMLVYGAAVFAGVPDDALLAHLAAFFGGLKP